MSVFEWDDLRYLLAFARAGTLQAAAKALGVNQSTVQRRILVLEQRAGRRLVERHRGSYRMTELGSELISSVEDVEAAVAAFGRRLAASEKGLTGTIRVTCGSNLAARLGNTPLIDAFHARHPGLRLVLLISDRFLDLSKGEADVAIRRGEPQDQSLVGRKIADAIWSVYASRAYVERHGRPKGNNRLNESFRYWLRRRDRQLPGRTMGTVGGASCCHRDAQRQLARTDASGQSGCRVGGYAPLAG